MAPKTNSLGWATVKFVLLVLTSIIMIICVVLWRVDVGAGRVEVLVGDAADGLARADVAEPLAREGRDRTIVGVER